MSTSNRLYAGRDGRGADDYRAIAGRLGADPVGANGIAKHQRNAKTVR